MHTPVLLKEVLELLDFQDGDVYLDATLGEGGHLEAVFGLEKEVVIAGIDVNPIAVEKSKERVREGKFAALNFRNIDKALEILGIGEPNKILFDLGWSKEQFEESGKGFSFQKDELLDMRFAVSTVKDSPWQNQNQRESLTVSFTAYDIVNKWDEENIATIIESYGEEKFAKKIAKQIVEARLKKPIKTTFELVEIIKKATPLWYHGKKIHLATKTFQAIRIAVNDELRALEEGLDKAFKILKKNGRLAVISFHSLEDRIVKKFFRELKEKGEVEILTKKPVRASNQEISNNGRSRSAKLRGITKT